MYNKNSAKLIEYQRSLLADQARTRSFQQAIRQVVRPGDVVLDLGCGSGILAFFACQAGARRVYAIEVEATIGLARLLARKNGLTDKVVFFQGISTQVELPEKVDVLVSETIGNFGLEEGILGWVLDARRRFLKEGARILPAALSLFTAPVEHPEGWQKIDSWKSDLYGLDFSLARGISANQLAWPYLDPAALLGEPARLADIQLSTVSSDQLKAETVLTIQRPGVLHGLGGWFQAELAAGITVTNAPGSATSSWRQAFLPFEQPLSVAPGERYRAVIHIAENGGLWTWSLQQVNGPGLSADPAKTRRQSTFLGQLMPPPKND